MQYFKNKVNNKYNTKENTVISNHFIYFINYRIIPVLFLFLRFIQSFFGNLRMLFKIMILKLTVQLISNFYRLINANCFTYVL